MHSKVRAVVSGLGACAALGLFLIGVPVCLVKLVGNPLPAAVPTWSSVVSAVEGGTLPTGALSGVLAVAVWIWWSQVALSAVTEVQAACRGRAARALPLRGLGMQPIMIRLVAVVVTAAAAVGTLAQPALAATPSFADIAVPMTSGQVSGGVPGEPGSATPILGTRTLPAAGSPPAPVLRPPAGPVAGVDESPPAPVLGVAEGSRPATVMSQPAPADGPTGARATSARWDPVVVPRTVEQADQVPVAEPAEPAWVVVKPGDSLWLLAERHLGDASRWADIFEVNVGQLPGGGTLRDPNLIHSGWRLRLPPPDPVASAEPEVVVGGEAPAPSAGVAPR